MSSATPAVIDLTRAKLRYAMDKAGGISMVLPNDQKTGSGIDVVTQDPAALLRFVAALIDETGHRLDEVIHGAYGDMEAVESAPARDGKPGEGEAYCTLPQIRLV